MLYSTLMRYFFLTTIALTSFAFCDTPNMLTADEQSAGWKLLFDGKTSTGWRGLGKAEFPDQGWVVEDGTLKHIAKGGGGNIVTAEEFENFELSWEWKIAPVGNSGLKYNLADPKKDIGFEYQLLDDEKHPDGIRGGRLHQTGGLYDLIEPPADKKVKPIGEWNQSRLVVSGNKVEQWLNGVKTVEFVMSSDDMKARVAKSKYKNIAGFGEKKKGPILLQDHGDEISFRSVKIHALK